MATAVTAPTALAAALVTAVASIGAGAEDTGTEMRRRRISTLRSGDQGWRLSPRPVWRPHLSPGGGLRLRRPVRRSSERSWCQ